MWCRKSTSDKAGDEAEEIKQQAASAAKAASDAAAEARKRYEDAHAPPSPLHEWKENVTGAATHAWDVLAHKAADLASELAQRASESAHHVGEAARTNAEVAGDVAHKKWDVVSHRAADAAQSAQSVARDKAEKAQRAANRAQTAAQIAAQIAAAGVASHAPDAVHHAKQNALRRGGELGVKLGSALIDKSAPYAPHAVKKAKEPDWTSKLLWIGAGVVAGAALALLLSPNSGRRNRALLKDKLNHAGHEAGDLKEAALKKAEHLSNRASGLAHEIKERKSGEDNAENSDESGA